MIHILVVEDDTNLNKIVCSYLNNSGFEAKGCLNVEDAYDEMYNNMYEMIISDVMMPGIDGFEFAQIQIFVMWMLLYLYYRYRLECLLPLEIEKV